MAICVHTFRFAPSRSAAPVAVSLKLRVYSEYRYLNTPILMPEACDCLKNVHCMSAIYLLHLLILPRCLQLVSFFVFWSVCFFFSIRIFRFAKQIVKVPKRQMLYPGLDTFQRGRGPPYQYPFRCLQLGG